MFCFLKAQSALPLTGITEVAEKASSACHATVFVEEGAGPTLTCGMSSRANAWKRFRTQTWAPLARLRGLQVCQTCRLVLNRVEPRGLHSAVVLCNEEPTCGAYGAVAWHSMSCYKTVLPQELVGRGLHHSSAESWDFPGCVALHGDAAS